MTLKELEQCFYRESTAARYVLQHLPAGQSGAAFRVMVQLAHEFELP